MHTQNLIAINEFCIDHNIENTFIYSLQQCGLIEIITIKDNGFIDSEQIQYLECIVNLYYELDINMEGIESITHLLKTMNDMHNEIIALKNRIRLYE